MDAQAAEIIFSLLVAGALVLTVVVLVSGDNPVRAELRLAAPGLAATVAVGATAGSLYFSEVRHFTPCEFCWYQRIAMYPLAVILTMAWLRRDRTIRPYALALAGIGAALSLYHYQLQLVPDQGSSCSADVPCTFRYIEVAGFVTIPLLALGSFVLIITLLLAAPTAPSSPDPGAPT